MPALTHEQNVNQNRREQLDALKRQVSRLVIRDTERVELVNGRHAQDSIARAMGKLPAGAGAEKAYVFVGDGVAPPNTPSESSYESDVSAGSTGKKPQILCKSMSFDSASSNNGRMPTTWRSHLYILWVIIFFMASSLGAIFINKTCLTGYHFRYPLTLMLGQMAFAILLLTTLHVVGYNRLPDARNSDLIVLAVPTALFTSNIVVGLSALSLVNIPMFSAFRRLTLLFVMAAEYFLLHKTHSRAIMKTVIVMTIGAFISAVDDVSFSRLGYCLVFVNNVLTAAYLASIKRAMKITDFNPLALLYYTALMGFPLVTAMVISTGEIAHVIIAFRTQPELSSLGFMISLLLTATGAFAVNFSTSLCTDVTSPLTTSVAGQVKNILQTILGFFSWGFVPTTLNIVGLMLALCAQVYFAYLKYKEQNMSTWKPVPKSDSDERIGGSERDNEAEIQISDPDPVRQNAEELASSGPVQNSSTAGPEARQSATA